MFRLINDWLKLQQSEIPLLFTRGPGHVFVSQEISEKICSWYSEMKYSMESPQPHHTLLAKTGGRMEGEITGIQLFFFPAIFPLPSKCSASRIPQQPGKLRLSSPPSPPKLGWTHCKKFNPNPIPTSSCVQGKEGKNRNSMSLEKMHKAQTAGPPGKSNQVFISQAEEFQLFNIFRL